MIDRSTRIPAALLAVLLASCGDPAAPPPPPPPPPPATIVVTPATLSLVVTEAATLSATVTNSTAGVTWSSSSQGVATVDQSGLVTAVAEGSATITAALVGQSSVSATAGVTVIAPSVGVSGITSGGQPVNLAAIEGSIVVGLNAVLPSGFTGVARVLLNGAVAGTADIVNGVQAAAGTGASMAASSGEPIDVPLSVTVLTQDIVERPPFDPDVAPTAKWPNGSYQIDFEILQGLTVAADGSGPVLTLNNETAVVYLRSGMSGPARTNVETGRTYHQGDYNARFGIVSYGAAQAQSFSERLERVEVLRNPAISSAYGPKATAGVVNIVRRGTDAVSIGGLDGLEGRYRPTVTLTTDLEGTFESDILNLLDPYRNFLPPVEHSIDFLDPSFRPFGFTLEKGAVDAWIGRQVRFDWRAELEGFTLAGNDPTVWDEGVGLDAGWFTVGPDINNIDPTPVTVGGDIPETLTASLALTYNWSDRFGQVASLRHSDGLGAFTPLGVDYGTNLSVAPLSTFGGQPGIEPGALNVPAGRKLYWDGAGYGPSGFAGFLVKAVVDAPGITPAGACVEGTYDPNASWAYGAGPFNTCVPTWQTTAMFDPAFLATLPNSAFVTFGAGVRDRAYNTKMALVPILQDANSPVVSGFTTDPSFTVGQDVNFGWASQDDLTLSLTWGSWKFENDSRWIVDGVQGWFNRQPGQTGGFVPTAASTYMRRLPGFLEGPTQNAFGRWAPNGVGNRVRSYAYVATDVALNEGRGVHDFGTTVQGAFTRISTTLFDGVSYRWPSLTVCHNPGGAGDCHGVPETVTQIADMFLQAGGSDPLEEFRFAQSTTFNGRDVAFLFPVANRTETDFGTYKQVQYGLTLSGATLPPGTHDFAAYGFTSSGTAWKLPSFMLDVMLADAP